MYQTFFEILLHFVRRGREGIREQNKDEIIFNMHDEDNTEFATLRFNPHEKKTFWEVSP